MILAIILITIAILGTAPIWIDAIGEAIADKELNQ